MASSDAAFTSESFAPTVNRARLPPPRAGRCRAFIGYPDLRDALRLVRGESHPAIIKANGAARCRSGITRNPIWGTRWSPNRPLFSDPSQPEGRISARGGAERNPGHCRRTVPALRTAIHVTHNQDGRGDTEVVESVRKREVSPGVDTMGPGFIVATEFGGPNVVPLGPLAPRHPGPSVPQGVTRRVQHLPEDLEWRAWKTPDRTRESDMRTDC